MTCPFCESDDVELVSPWGGQMITSQMRCRGCNTYFEAIREAFDAVVGGSEPGESGSSPQLSRERNGRIPLRESGATPPV